MRTLYRISIVLAYLIALAGLFDFMTGILGLSHSRYMIIGGLVYCLLALWVEVRREENRNRPFTIVLLIAAALFVVVVSAGDLLSEHRRLEERNRPLDIGAPQQTQPQDTAHYESPH
jgi:hypothetical protein